MPFTQKSLNSIITDVLLNIFTQIDEITDANVGGIMRKMAEAICQEISLLYDSLDTVYKGSRIDTATGTDLEQIGLIVGIDRKAGVKSQGNVSFIRQEAATADFTIASGGVIATAPNTGEEQLKFIVLSNTTFKSSIIDEQHTFIDGIYDYSMDERFIDTVDALTGTVSSVIDTPLVENTDFSLIKNATALIVDTTTITEVETCEVADWTQSTDADNEVLDPANYKQGTNSLSLGKSGTSSITASYEKVLGSVKDGTNKDLVVWLYIDNNTDLIKIKNLYLLIGSGGDANNSYEISYDKNSLVVGWQQLTLRLTATNVQRVGTPIISTTNFLRLKIETNNATDIIASGSIKMDYWLFADTTDYEGDLIRFIQTGTSPDTTTIFKVDYTPLSKEVLCEAENIGANYNVKKKKIDYKISSITNINNVLNYVIMSGGVDLETDTSLRQRIQFATELKGKATAESLRQALLAVNGVSSVSVDDLPFQTASDEGHTFSTGLDEYQLDFEVAIDDTTLKISNSVGGPANYVKGTDYVLDSLSRIVWQSAGTKPANGAEFYVTYNYDWLGHVDIYIAGQEFPLPSQVVTDANTAVDDTKAAGVTVQLLQPSVINVDVTCDVVADTINGYSFSTVGPAVKTAIENFLDNLPVEQDVFVAEIIATIMSVDGVDNTVLNLPVADVVIAPNQVARTGVVTVNEL